jgi:transposase
MSSGSGVTAARGVHVKQATAYIRDLKGLEIRRRQGMKLLQGGISQAEVARRMGVSRQTASSWNRALAGDAQAWRARPLGRPAGLDGDDKRRLLSLLRDGARRCGIDAPHWTLNLVRDLIAREFGQVYSTVHVKRLLRSLDFDHRAPQRRRSPP